MQFECPTEFHSIGEGLDQLLTDSGDVITDEIVDWVDTRLNGIADIRELYEAIVTVSAMTVLLERTGEEVDALERVIRAQRPRFRGARDSQEKALIEESKASAGICETLTGQNHVVTAPTYGAAAPALSVKLRDLAPPRPLGQKRVVNRPK